MEIIKNHKIQLIITILLLAALPLGLFLVQRQQVLKSKASQEVYNGFAVQSGDSQHYVNCSGNVCDTNTLNIAFSIRDLQALDIQEQQVAVAKTDVECRSELGEIPPYCDVLSKCMKNIATAKGSQCGFDQQEVDLSLCPNNCQSNGTQTILCQEFETCEKDQNGLLTGNLLKRWLNEAGGQDGCQPVQKSADSLKCPSGQTLAANQFTAQGGGFTGQKTSGIAPIPSCSAQDFATACWQGADCQAENQNSADKACSNNHGVGSVCTRSTGASSVFDDGCTKPAANVAISTCSGQYFATACWQGADCKVENQASADAACSQNHGSGSVCTRATGSSNTHDDGCTFGSSDQFAPSQKNCSSEANVTACWIGARCDTTNQRFADHTCVNNHGQGSMCLHLNTVGGTGMNDDGCSLTALDFSNREKANAAQNPECQPLNHCDPTTSDMVFQDSCGKITETRKFDLSCAPEGLDPKQAMDLHLESQRLARAEKAQQQTQGLLNGILGLPGGIWNLATSWIKESPETPTVGEVTNANAQAFSQNIQSFLGETQRNAQGECAEAAGRKTVGLPVEKELEDKCFGPAKSIEENAADGLKTALDSGSAKAGLGQMGVNMDVGDTKIAKTGICLNTIFNLDLNARCLGFTGESVVPAAASQNLSEVLRKQEVVKLAEGLGLDLTTDPNSWEAAKREFFFNAAARSDINASKYAAEFFGVPITAWENADQAAKICAREHGSICFVDRFNPASVAGLKDEDVEKIKSIYRGWTPAPLEQVRNYASYLSFAADDPTAGKRFLGHLPPEELENVKRTYEVYQNAAEYFKENTTSGRLYNEKRAEALTDTAIGIVSTVVDPMPVAQALSSGLKYVVVKQVWNRLSDRFGSKVASEIVQNAEKAIARGAATTAAEKEALRLVNGVADEEEAKAGLVVAEKGGADSDAALISNIEGKGGVEPPPAVKALVDAKVDPKVQQTAAQGLKDAHNGSGKLDGTEAVVPTSDAPFIEPSVPVGNPVEAVQNGVNGLVEDAGRLLRREEPAAPVVDVAEKAAERPSNPVLAEAAGKGEAEEASLVVVADDLAGTEARLTGRPLEETVPNPAEGILTDAGNGVKAVTDNVGEHLGLNKSLPIVNGDSNLGVLKLPKDKPPPFKFNDSPETTVKVGDKTFTIGDSYAEIDGEKIIPVRLDDGTVAMAYLSTSKGNFKWFVGVDLDNKEWFIKSSKGKEIMNVPPDLDRALAEVFNNNKVTLLSKYDSKVTGQKEQFNQFMGQFGFARTGTKDYEKLNTGKPTTMDRFLDRLGMTDRDITTEDALRIARNMDLTQPIDVFYNRTTKSVEAYYRGDDPLFGPQVIKFTHDLESGLVDFSLRPADDPFVTYKPAYLYSRGSGKGVPIYDRGFGIYPGFDEITGLGRESNFGKTIKQLTHGYTKQPSEAEISRLIEEFKPRDPLAPCPIFTLTPIAYAEGSIPCPKNPLVALWHNVQNTGKQVLDRFNPPKPQSTLDQLIPATDSERTILNKAKIVEAVTDKDISLLNKAGAEVAQQAKDFDYVIVSGQSADISETILRKQGISQDKIIKFSVDDNAHVYKIVEGQATQFTEAERNAFTREALEKKGINLSGDRKPTFLIVDDISDTGYKATAYLDRFSQIEGVGETKYAALTAKNGVVINPAVAGSGLFADFSRGRLEELAQKTFVPSKLKPAESLRVNSVINNLSNIVAGYTKGDKTISYSVKQQTSAVVEHVLDRINPQRANPSNIVLMKNVHTQVILRFDQKYRAGGSGEFEALSKLHQVAPDHVVKPVELLKEGGVVVGYKTEAIDGIVASKYVDLYGGLTQDMKDQIIATLENFHAHGLAHGDPSLRTIIISPDGKIKFLEPVSYTDFKPEYAKFDMDEINRTLGNVKTIHKPGQNPILATLDDLRYAVQNTGRQIGDTLQSWFNGILNIGKKQSLSLEVAVV